MSYLGVDIGTSGCKAAIFDQNGNCLAGAYRSYAVITPRPDQAELNSDEVIDKCFTVIREAVRQYGSRVKALGISSQGEAFTPIGEDGSSLANAMISSDCRAQAQVNKWVAQFGGEKLYRLTGHSASAMFTLFKLLWLKENRPDIWAASKAFYCFEDLLHLRLGISPAMGWPLAARTMLFDINQHCWSEEILTAIGLSKTQLARPLPSGTVAGVIPDAVAATLGLPAGVKVVTGGHDQPICALGAGVTAANSAMYATGTVECICPVLPDKVLNTELYRNNLCCYDYSLPGKYTTVAYCLTGGNILQWFKNQFGQELSYDELIEQIPEEPTGLMALPYFTPSGTPYFDTITPGTITGLRLSTSRHEILKALLEGVLMEMKLNLSLLADSGIAINKLIATGGGARNMRWLQLKADILNMPIIRKDISEAGCRGAAMLACTADTGSGFCCEIGGQSITPDPKKSAIYEDKFIHYRKLYSSIKELYQNLR